MTNNQIGQGTAQGLLDYLDMLIEKGRATHGAVQPLKTAFTKVLEAVDGKEWKQTKVEDIDVADYIDRFGNLTRGTYSNQSLTAYKSRVGRAIAWYLKFMNQAGWMPNIKARAPRQTSNTQKRPIDVDDSAAQQPVKKIHNQAGVPTLDEGINYPFPLASGEVATIYMPKTVIKGDVKRLAVFLDALVVGGGNE